MVETAKYFALPGDKWRAVVKDGAVLRSLGWVFWRFPATRADLRIVCFVGKPVGTAVIMHDGASCVKHSTAAESSDLRFVYPCRVAHPVESGILPLEGGSVGSMGPAICQ
jgi:hypothetical protein